MSAKRKPFIVLTFGDRERYGFDEQMLPRLVALMDSACPDYRYWHHAAVTGYFVASARSFRRVERVIERVEELRRAEPRFECVGIGLSAGELIAEFTWMGRLKHTGTPPIGTASNLATQLVTAPPDAYRSILDLLRNKYCYS